MAARSSPTTCAKTGRTAHAFTAKGGTYRCFVFVFVARPGDPKPTTKLSMLPICQRRPTDEGKHGDIVYFCAPGACLQLSSWVSSFLCEGVIPFQTPVKKTTTLRLLSLVRGLLGTDPTDLTLESAPPSPPRGSIWHRFDIDLKSIS